MNFKQAIITIALTGIVAPAAHAVNMTNTSKTRGCWMTIYDRGQQATFGRADIVKIEVTSDPYCKQQTLCGTDTYSHSAQIRSVCTEIKMVATSITRSIIKEMVDIRSRVRITGLVGYEKWRTRVDDFQSGCLALGEIYTHHLSEKAILKCKRCLNVD